MDKSCVFANAIRAKSVVNDGQTAITSIKQALLYVDLVVTDAILYQSGQWAQSIEVVGCFVLLHSLQCFWDVGCQYKEENFIASLFHGWLIFQLTCILR